LYRECSVSIFNIFFTEMLNTFYSKGTGFLIERNTLFPRRLEFFPPLRTDGTHWLEPFQGRRQTFTQVTFIVVFVSNSFWRGSRHRRFDLRLIENTWTLDLMYFFWFFGQGLCKLLILVMFSKCLAFISHFIIKREQHRIKIITITSEEMAN